MNFIDVKAYAKLNLSLDVTGVREDGYHEMYMVMQSATLCDSVNIVLTGGEFTSASNLRFIPNDDRNLAIKAAKVFFEAADIRGGARINIKKRIPVGSGMGGGSSDAAAVLRGLNAMKGKPFTMKELEALGGRVGSDVPFCLAGGTQLASGRGEILRPLPPLPRCGIVICKPNFSISTPELFRKLDSAELKCRPDTAGIIKALENRDLTGVARRMYNVFEDVPDQRHKSIESIRRELLSGGALGAIMTGSGSAVFGVFADENQARNVYIAMRKNHSACYFAKNMGRLKV